MEHLRHSDQECMIEIDPAGQAKGTGQLLSLSSSHDLGTDIGRVRDDKVETLGFQRCKERGVWRYRALVENKFEKVSRLKVQVHDRESCLKSSPRFGQSNLVRVETINLYGCFSPGIEFV